MAGDRMGAGIVGRECQRGIAELLEHHQKVTGRTVEVLRENRLSDLTVDAVLEAVTPLIRKHPA